MKSRKFSQLLLLAIELPRFARESLVESRKVWRKQLEEDLRWIPPLNLHLTLRYLGELDIAKSKALCKDLTALGQSTEPFLLSVDEIGCSPTRQEAKSLWLGLSKSEELEKLRLAVDQCCDKQKIAKDKLPFERRIKLTRISEPQCLPPIPLRTELKGFKVKSFTLLESRQGQKSPTYHPLCKFELLGSS